MSAAAMGNHDHLFSFWSEANKRREDRIILVRKPIILCKYISPFYSSKGLRTTAVLKPTCAPIKSKLCIPPLNSGFSNMMLIALITHEWDFLHDGNWQMLFVKVLLFLFFPQKS